MLKIMSFFSIKRGSKDDKQHKKAVLWLKTSRQPLYKIILDVFLFINVYSMIS